MKFKKEDLVKDRSLIVCTHELKPDKVVNTYIKGNTEWIDCGNFGSVPSSHYMLWSEFLFESIKYQKNEVNDLHREIEKVKKDIENRNKHIEKATSLLNELK